VKLSDAALSDPATWARTLQQASELLATDPAQARRHAQAILEQAPGDPRAALIVASAQRRLGDAAAAHALLAPLAARFPRAALTHYELGLALAALGQSAKATEALRHAVALKPDFGDGWRALGELLFRSGDESAARAAFARHERASISSPALAEAADALLEGRLVEAEQAIRTRLASAPTDLEALRLLAFAVARQDHDVEAEALFELYLQHRPEDDGARFGFAEVLFRRTKGAAARAQVEPLFERDPNHPAYRNLLAACLAQLGEWDWAVALYELLLAEYDRQPRIWLNYGHALRTLGRAVAAADAYRRAIALRPVFGEPYWSLANLKTQAFSSDDESCMTGALQSVGNDDDELHLHFALGKALEDRGQYSESFAHYAAGAAIRRSQVTYDADAITRRVQTYKQVFSRHLFAGAPSACDSSAPLFVVGLPRSGSTLVEQILASHSAVEGTLELPDIGHLVEELTRTASERAGDSYPQMLERLRSTELRMLGEDYLERTRIHRKRGTPRFIDKMPNNFIHIGLIHLILPRACIIDVRRHPLGACFSAFKQHFAQGQTFSYDLTDLGRYYRDYVDLLRHFDAVLPGRVHRVIYEDLVVNPEDEIRRLLQFCDLPFEIACLKFYETQRPVRTVSSEQVRRPLYRDALERWRHYEPWLGPLQSALGTALGHWRT
jgi:tetratricopeptide (TPR) repeat protein